MNGEKILVLQKEMRLMNLKQSCFTCPMFQICNGCKKTIKDLKDYDLVESHCITMKKLAPKIIEINHVNMEVTPYIDESVSK